MGQMSQLYLERCFGPLHALPTLLSKNFSELNVNTTDEDGNSLEIISVNINKILHKEFNVKMKNPIKPRQRKRFVTMSYDWEEPERNYFYKVATDCKSLKYKLVAPKQVEIKNRILKVDIEMGYKWVADPAAETTYGKDTTTIT